MNFTSFHIEYELRSLHLARIIICMLWNYFQQWKKLWGFWTPTKKTSKLASFVNKSYEKLGTKLYEPKTIVSAFNNFTILKVLQTLQQHENFNLISVSTLMKITSSVAHVRRFCFVQRIEGVSVHLQKNRKFASYLYDVKKMLTYYWGTVYGELQTIQTFLQKLV